MTKMKHYRHIILCAILLCGITFSGCSRKILGNNVSSSQAKGKTLSNACMLIAGSTLAAIAASGKDYQISSYAAEHAPVYGSASNATNISDVLQFSSIGLALLLYAVKYSPLVNDNFNYPSTASSSAKSLASSAALIQGTTESLKRYTARPRPDGVDNRSFPSGHTVVAVWGYYGSAKMIPEFDLPRYYEIPAQSVLALMTLGTAWGRIEGKKHYPTDVLAAMLLGVALTDASFALFDNDYNNQTYYRHGKLLDIQIVNERGVSSTGLAATIEF